MEIQYSKFISFNKINLVMNENKIITKFFNIILILILVSTLSLLENNSLFNNSNTKVLNTKNDVTGKYFDPNLNQILQNIGYNLKVSDIEDLIIIGDEITDIQTVVAKYNGAIIDFIPILSSFRIVIPKVNYDNFQHEIDIHSVVNFHQQNYLSTFPNDPYYSLQWHIEGTSIDTAWNKSKGENNVLIGIIDTGVDYNHPDLSSNYDSRGYDWFRNDTDPMDELNHGTHVAGIISSEINNGIGTVGVGNIRYFSEKVFGDISTTGDWYLAQGIIDATEKGANITSNSWSGDYSTVVHDAFIYANSKGVISVAAAGNDNINELAYPGAYPEVIAVSATTQLDDKSAFSNWGNWIDIAAPGTNIYSTLPNDNYGFKSGTSMSAPLVSGIFGLMVSYYGDFMNPDTLSIVLPHIVDDLGVTGKDDLFGYGRINASKALDLALPPIVDFSNFPRDPVISNSIFLNFSIIDPLDSLMNISLELLLNGTHHSTLWTINNTNLSDFSLPFNSSNYLDGGRYQFYFNVSNGIFEKDYFYDEFYIDNIKHQIDSVLIISPEQYTNQSEFLFIEWEVRDIDGPPHLTNISLIWDSGEKFFGTTSNYSMNISIAGLTNGTNYRVKLFVTDFSSNFTLIGNNFSIANPPHRPDFNINYPILNPDSVFSGNLTISWNQSDIDNDFLNTTLWIINSNYEYKLINKNFSNSSNIITFDTNNVLDGFYFLRFVITDNYFTIGYNTIWFEIDNPHLPEISFSFPSSNSNISTGLLNVSWNLYDQDNDSLNGEISYRDLNDPFNWVHLLNINKSGFFIFDTGALILENGTLIQLRMNTTDGWDFSIIDSQFITIIRPIIPIISITNSFLNNVTFSTLSGIIEFKWEAFDQNKDLLMHSLWIFDFSINKWSLGYSSTFDYFIWNSTEFSPGNYFIKLFTFDGYYNISTDIGLLTLIESFPFSAVVKFPENEYNYFSLDISWNIEDMDSNDFTFSLYYRHFDSNDWNLIEDFSDQKKNSHFLWTTMELFGKIILQLKIGDHAFEKTYTSQALFLNHNNRPNIDSITYDTIIYFESSLLKLNFSDIESQDLKITVLIKETQNWSKFREIILSNSNYHYSISLPWSELENGIKDVNISIQDLQNGEITLFSKSDSILFQLEVAIPKISYESDLLIQRSAKSLFIFILEDPKNIIEKGKIIISSKLNKLENTYTFNALNITTNEQNGKILELSVDTSSFETGGYSMEIILEGSGTTVSYSVDIEFYQTKNSFSSFYSLLGFLVLILVAIIRKKKI